MSTILIIINKCFANLLLSGDYSLGSSGSGGGDVPMCVCVCVCVCVC